MDRTWMSANRMSKEYRDGVKDFVRVAVAHAKNKSKDTIIKIICPCLKCCYRDVSADELEDHLIWNGIDKSYTCWTLHGEKKTKSTNLRNAVRDTSNDFERDTYEFDRVEEFVNVVEEDLRDCPKMFERLISGWKKKSIFFELSYWKSLYVRHFLDVMHIEKNVFESVIGTLLNVPGKSKDGIKARLDLQTMRLRKGLHPVKKGSRTYLPPTAHTLSRKEKTKLCRFLHEVKVPEGYSSNIRSLVSMKDLKLKGLKSHDCHVLMENFLPIGIRSILPEKVRWTITKLCFFFKAICSKVIDPGKLLALQQEIVVTLCELEMYFPPSFFDIMVHLTVHLVMETQYYGPAYMRWMYPIEQAIEFCTEYLSNVEPIGIPISRHSGRTTGEELVQAK
ncbi:unnamed protein product [Trifolium pratense]|uniref:Uncharacterized protein n=1 Tax=Trifolium pratense TaxID=57577 RepID=A0ACB0K717_TRIPR|nr:unnamed protein product [Trifolium pratense]